jgi:hypothetical protein
MIQSFDESEYISNIRSVIYTLFGNDGKPDPYLKAFLPFAERSLILFDYDGSPNKQLMKAIAEIASQQGENGFYLTIPEPHPLIKDYAYHWYISFDEINQYEKITMAGIRRYVYFSARGTWGVMPSFDLFAVIGGSKYFMDRLCGLVPGIEDDVRVFIEHWQIVKKKYPSKTDVSWVKPLLMNTYEKKYAKKLLGELGWED